MNGTDLRYRSTVIWELKEKSGPSAVVYYDNWFFLLFGGRKGSGRVITSAWKMILAFLIVMQILRGIFKDVTLRLCPLHIVPRSS